MVYVAAVILAAGNSKRFGSTKLASSYMGRMLISYVLESVAASEISQVIVVVNASTKGLILGNKICKAINNFPERGVGYSISLGISEVNERASGALIIPADMPNIFTSLINRYIEKHRSFPESIISGIHNSVPMVPVLFPRQFFSHLLAMDGDRGARGLVMGNKNNVYIELDQDEIKDVDYTSDLK